jgi:hypothetical protein
MKLIGSEGERSVLTIDGKLNDGWSYTDRGNFGWTAPNGSYHTYSVMGVCPTCKSVFVKRTDTTDRLHCCCNCNPNSPRNRTDEDTAQEDNETLKERFKELFKAFQKFMDEIEG